MAIHQRLVVVILAFTVCQWACIQGLSIQNCDEENVAELNLDDTNLNKTFTCVGIRNNGMVGWSLTTRQGNYLPAIYCKPFTNTVKSCNTSTSNLKGSVFPERTSRSESTMTIHVPPLQSTLQNATLLCRDTSEITTCPLDLIRPVDGACRANLVTDSSREWSVHVRCAITRGYSTMGRYSCLFSQESPRKREVKDIRMTNADRLPQESAECDHEFGVNTTYTGRHRYSVQLTPGQTNVTVQGDITIERPEEPSIIQCQPNLEEGMVPENQTLRCQCQAESLGKPGGVLKWSRKDKTDSRYVILEEGEEGQSSLPFSAVLTRHDHMTRLRCGVQWGKEFIRRSIDVSVGYPASQVVLDINSWNQVVAEKSSATFKCWATDGRPSPTLTLRGKGSGAELVTGNASLTYNWPDVRCQDSGTYTCTASNGMGPDKTVTSFLNVTCGPQGFSGQIPPFRYQDEEMQFTFDLVANPPPFKVTFLFLGSSEANSTSEVKDIVLSGRCQRKSETLVRATCTITLSNVTSSGAAGLYRGTLINGQGILDFHFEVKLNATVGPESGSDVVLVAGAVGGGIAALVIIVVAVVIVRRHTRKGSNKTMTLMDTRNTDGDHVYGNINVVNQMDRGAENNAGSLAPDSADAGHEVNADGLLYVSVDFSNKSASTFPAPAPSAEGEVLYSAVDFNRTAPTQ